MCQCPPGQSPCSNGQDSTSVCVALATDHSNCGRCGLACGNTQQCLEQPADAAAADGGLPGICTCPGGLTACGTACADTRSDEANCGACGHACGSNSACSAGVCTCLPGFSPCGDQCVNLLIDPGHCGTCTTVCGATQTCTLRDAGPGCVNCPNAGDVRCGNTCANLQTSSSNCGGCGNVCLNGKVCQTGQCACPAGLTECLSQCVNAQTDPNNCGTCGTVCPAARPNCFGGMCVAGPCDGLCTGAIPIPMKTTISGITTNGGCWQTLIPDVIGGNCGNFATGRTMTVNGMLEPCVGGNWPSLPAKRAGGYCYVVSPGGTDTSAFFTVF